jgi:tRNA(fMet)-specific endonuclease VapC
MSGFLLDTSICVAVTRNRPLCLREHVAQKRASGASLSVSVIVLFELWYGVERSATERRAANAERLDRFLAGRLEILDVGAADAQRAALIRTSLQALGTPIGAYDLLIAAQAVERGLTLVTSNLAEFRRVDSLVCEDWAAAG